MTTDPGTLVTVLTFGLFLYSVILHEIAHGYVAYLLGDGTAKAEGRISLNPLVHIDPVWTILMPLLLYLSNMPLFGGAKGVPINPFHFRRPREGMMWTAMAGPATNIALAVLLALAYAGVIVFRAWAQPGADATASVAALVLRSGIAINLGLACFNLMPLPPLDGSRLLAWLLPRELAEKLDALERHGLLLLFALLYFAPWIPRFFFSYAARAEALLLGFAHTIALFVLKLL